MNTKLELLKLGYDVTELSTGGYTGSKVMHGKVVIITQHFFNSHLCGYVEHQTSCDTYNVHGGITYNDGEIIGFDCAHAGDYVPHLGFPKEDYEVYRTVEYVDAELEKLVLQIVK